MIRVLIIGALLASGDACTQVGEIKPTSNPKVTVEKLFEHEGCTMFRAELPGRSVYYVRCAAGEPTSTSWETTAKSGKRTVTTTHDVTTEEVR